MTIVGSGELVATTSNLLNGRDANAEELSVVAREDERLIEVHEALAQNMPAERILRLSYSSSHSGVQVSAHYLGSMTACEHIAPPKVTIKKHHSSCRLKLHFARKLFFSV